MNRWFHSLRRLFNRNSLPQTEWPTGQPPPPAPPSDNSSAADTIPALPRVIRMARPITSDFVGQRLEALLLPHGIRRVNDESDWTLRQRAIAVLMPEDPRREIGCTTLVFELFFASRREEWSDATTDLHREIIGGLYRKHNARLQLLAFFAGFRTDPAEFMRAHDKVARAT